jgi:hypothetical protein
VKRLGGAFAFPRPEQGGSFAYSQAFQPKNLIEASAANSTMAATPVLTVKSRIASGSFKPLVTGEFVE